MRQHDSLPEVGRYRLLSVLGRGGTAVVYRAHDRLLDREVALKLAHGGTGTAAELARQRLARELRVLRVLSEPGVPALLDEGHTDEGRPWLVVQRVDGPSLGVALGAERLAARLALLPVLARLARCLARVHARGIAHRDLKPDNVLVDDGGQPWLVDWGLAREPLAADPGSGENRPPAPAGTGVDSSEDSLVAGTPAYMSPEQIAGGGGGRTADVWALGLLLWELVHGVRAYGGERRSAVFGAILAGPPALDSAPEGCPAGLLALVEACLQPEAAARPPMAEVVGSLEALLRTPAAPVPPARSMGPAGGLVVVAAVLLGVVLGVVAGRREPATAAAVTPPDPASLSEAAWLAHRAGDVPRAEQLAVAALAAGGPPWLRGLLLRAQPRPDLTLDEDGLRCGIGEDLSPDGRTVICAQPDHTVAWRLDEHGVRELWRQEFEVHLIKFLGDTRLLLQAGEGDGAVVVELATGAPLTDPLGALRSSGRLSDSRREDRFFGQGPEGWVRVVLESEGTGRVHHVLESIPAPPCAGKLTVDERGRELVGCGDRVVALEAGQWRTVAERPADTAPWARWSWSGGLLVAAGEDHSLAVFDPASDRLQLAVDRSTATATEGPWMASQSHGHRIFVGRLGLAAGLWQAVPRHSAHRRITDDGQLVTLARSRVMRWRLPDTSGRRAWHAEGPVRELHWLPGALVVRRSDRTVRIWLDNGDEQTILGVRALAGGPAGLVVAQEGRLQRWTPTGGLRELAAVDCQAVAWLGEDVLCGPLGPGPLVVDGETGAVDARASLPDSTWFAAAGAVSGPPVAVAMEWSTRLVRLDGRRPGELEHLLRDAEARALSLSPDGRTLALSERYRIALVDLAGAPPLRPARFLSRGDHLATPHAWSPDSARIAAADLDGTVHLWDAATGVEQARLPPGEEGLVALAFSPDGRALALARPDGLITALELAPVDAPVEALADAVRRAWGPLP